MGVSVELLVSNLSQRNHGLPDAVGDLKEFKMAANQIPAKS
jgi:hypothetical protein